MSSPGATRIEPRAGFCRLALLIVALMALAAGCYSSNYRRGIEANVALVSDLADKLADYCRTEFKLDSRPVSSEEMGEFYYALKKARSFAAMTANSADKPSYRRFEQLLASYESFLQAADQYRLSARTDPEAQKALLQHHAEVTRQAQLVLDAIRAEAR